MTELGRLRRIEFALAAYGIAVALVVLATGIDAVRFHLPEALASGLHPSPGDAAVIALAALDGAIAAAAVASAVRQVGRSARFLRRLPVAGVVRADGRALVVVDDDAPRAFCAGLLRPRVHVSRGALRALSRRELDAVVAHEAHHARRRDPLRLLAARALSRSLPWAPGLRRLAERHATVAELAADAAALRVAGPRRHLASALLVIAADGGSDARGIAPERVDHLMGALPRQGAPAWGLASAALSLGVLFLAVVAAAAPGGWDICSAVLGSHAPALAAALAVIVLSPAWLVARSAAAAVRPAAGVGP